MPADIEKTMIEIKNRLNSFEMRSTLSGNFADLLSSVIFAAEKFKYDPACFYEHVLPLLARKSDEWLQNEEKHNDYLLAHMGPEPR